MNVNEQHAIVKNSLSQFMKKNIPGANLKKVDQIVLEYVVSILEEASQDESFDVEGEKKPNFDRKLNNKNSSLQHFKK